MLYLMGARKNKSSYSLGLAGTVVYNNGKMTELETGNLNSSSYSKAEQLHLSVEWRPPGYSHIEPYFSLVEEI